MVFRAEKAREAGNEEAPKQRTHIFKIRSDEIRTLFIRLPGNAKQFTKVINNGIHIEKVERHSLGKNINSNRSRSRCLDRILYGVTLRAGERSSRVCDMG